MDPLCFTAMRELSVPLPEAELENIVAKYSTESWAPDLTDSKDIASRIYTFSQSVFQLCKGLFQTEHSNYIFTASQITSTRDVAFMDALRKRIAENQTILKAFLKSPLAMAILGNPTEEFQAIETMEQDRKLCGAATSPRAASYTDWSKDSFEVQLMNPKLPKWVGDIALELSQLSDEARVGFFQVLESMAVQNKKLLHKFFTSPHITITEPKVDKVIPFFVWISKEKRKDRSEERQGELEELTSKFLSFLYEQPLLAARLCDIPADHISLWEHILEDDNISELNKHKVRNKLRAKSAQVVIDTVLDGQKSIDNIVTACGLFFKKHSPCVKGMFIKWVASLYAINAQSSESELKGVADEENPPLKPILSKLNVEDLRVIRNFTFINESNIATSILQFARLCPHSSQVSEFMEQCLIMAQIKEGHIKADDRPNHNSIDLLYKLAIKYPQVLHWLLIVGRYQPSKLPFLFHLSTKLDQEDFEFFVEHHIIDDIHDKPKDQLNAFSNLVDVENEGFDVRALQSLLKIEREYSIDILSSLGCLSNLRLPSLTKNLISNHDFAVNFSGKKFGELVLKVLDARLEKEPAQVFEIFNFAANFPNVLSMIISNSSTQNTETLNFVFEIFNLSKQKGTEEIVHRLLTIFDSQINIFTWDDFFPLFKDQELLGRVLDMCHAGWSADVKRLLNHPDPKLKEFLLAKAGSEQAPYISKILNVFPCSHCKPLIDFIYKDSPGKIFNPLSKALLTLHSRQENDLKDWALKALEGPRDFSKVDILEMISQGYFALARDHLYKELPVDLLKVSNYAQMQQIRDLYRSLKTTKKILLSDEELYTLINFLCEYVRWPAKSETALTLIGQMQFLLSHEPDTLNKILHSEAWQKLCKTIKTEDSAAIFLENAEGESYASYFLKEFKTDINAHIHKNVATIFEDAEKAVRLKDERLIISMTYKVSMFVARCLVTAGGNINTAMIQPLLDTIKALAHKHNYLKGYAFSHILFALEALKDNDFNQRLEKLTLPPQSSPQALLMKQMLGIKPEQDLTLYGVQIIVISALIWPIRQSGGTCFGTALAVQASSSVDGLKQYLEDMLSLVACGCLVRYIPGRSFPERFSLRMEPEFAKKYEGDHLLARYREYTIALMAESRNEKISGILSKWDGYFSKQIDSFIPSQNSLLNSKGFIKSILSMQMSNMCEMTYIPYTKDDELSYNTSGRGAWKIVDRSNGQALDESLTVLQSFFKKLLERFYQDLINENESPAVAEALIKHLFASIESPEFLGDFLNEHQKDLALINPKKAKKIKLHETRLVTFSGGQSINVIGSYHQTMVMRGKFKAAKHPLESVLHYAANISAAEKKAAKSNPLLLKTVAVPRHAMNLRIGRLSTMVNDIGLRKIMEQVSASEKIMHSKPLTAELSQELFSLYLSKLPKTLQASFEKEFFKIYKKVEFKNVLEFSKMMVHINSRITFDPNERMNARMRVSFCIQSMSQLESSLHEYIPVFDTNWRFFPAMGYRPGAQLNKKLYTLSAYSGEPIPMAFGIKNPMSWYTYEYRPCFDDVTRNYFIPARTSVS